MRSRPHRHRREDPLLARFTLWVLKSALGGLAFVLLGVALANYQVILHHDGQVEFARKNAWTLADTFRFVGEIAAPPAPTMVASAPPVQVASLPVHTIQPALLSQPGLIVAPSPSPAPSVPARVTSPTPAPARVASPAPARVTSPPPVRVAKPVKKPVVVEEEDEEEDEPDGTAECRTVRATLARAVGKYEKARGRMTELRIFDLIGAGVLREIVSCPSMGGLAIRRGRSGAEVRCSVHGPK